MQHHLKALLANPSLGRKLAAHGLQTIRSRHTCAHRVDELLQIYAQLEGINQAEAILA